MSTQTTGPAPIEPSAERMKATVAALAARELGGRRAGSPGGAAARGWLVAELTALDAVSEVDQFATPAGNAGNIYATFADAAPGSLEIWLTAQHTTTVSETLRASTGPAPQTTPPVSQWSWRPYECSRIDFP
jgi:hypothetical protein